MLCVAFLTWLAVALWLVNALRPIGVLWLICALMAGQCTMANFCPMTGSWRSSSWHFALGSFHA